MAVSDTNVQILATPLSANTLSAALAAYGTAFGVSGATWIIPVANGQQVILAGKQNIT